MQLNTTTGYAICITIYLASKKDIASAHEISEQIKIPRSVVFKVTDKLSRAGIIKNHLGKQGGFSLIKEPKEITLLDILLIMENTIKINRCLEDDELCFRKSEDDCKIRNFYEKFQKEMEEKFNSITIEDFI